MLAPLFALFVVGLIVISAEGLWMLKILRREAGRKFIHILAGVWVAMWPLFLSFRAIFYLALLMLAGVFVVRALKLGKSIHTIDRLSKGDVLFPIGIALTSLATSSPWIFSAAILNIGLADGLAGLIGSHYAVLEYKVLGHKKSVLGTAIFILASLVIITAAFNYGLNSSGGYSLTASILLVPLLTAAAENISPFGIDNITVPLLTVFLLTNLVG